MKENHLNKVNADFGNLLKEKLNSYEALNNITKNKYEDIINNKENEIKELKATILTYKIERDKYLNDCNLFKNEYDKIEQKFSTENEIYIKKYEEAQNTLNMKSNDYISKINELKIDKENLQHENKIMKDEIKEYNQKEKSYELKIKNLEKNEDDLKRENYDLKKNGDIYLKQNAAYTKEIERIKQNYRIQMEQEKENINLNGNNLNNQNFNFQNQQNQNKQNINKGHNMLMNVVQNQNVLYNMNQMKKNL